MRYYKFLKEKFGLIVDLYDYKKSFANKCTNEYTAEQVKNIEEVQEWLKEQ